MGKTKIEWTDNKWNPIRGCSRVSEGCRNCYAERMAARFSGPGRPYEGLAEFKDGKPRWTGKLRFVPEHLKDPLKWKQPLRIFVNSMSDLFHEDIPDEWIDQIFAVMAMAPQHTFQILTKRAKRMREYLKTPWRADSIGDAMILLRLDDKDPYPMREDSLPLKNVWLGVSVEDRKALDRIDVLRQVPAAVRFLSIEPFLEDLGLIDLNGIHWVIVGGESGPGARRMYVEWVRSLRDQCQAAGVPYFFKQWGAWITEEYEDGPQMRKVGKKAAGRLLDGRTWDEYPNLGGMK